MNPRQHPIAHQLPSSWIVDPASALFSAQPMGSTYYDYAAEAQEMCQHTGFDEAAYEPTYVGVEEELLQNYLLFEFPEASIAACDPSANSALSGIVNTAFPGTASPLCPDVSCYTSTFTQNHVYPSFFQHDLHSAIVGASSQGQDATNPIPAHLLASGHYNLSPQPGFVDPALLYDDNIPDAPSGSVHILEASASSSSRRRRRHGSSSRASSSSPYPYPYPYPYTSPSPEPSQPDLITCKRRNVHVSLDVIPPPTVPRSKWQCPYCPYFQHNRRSPDMKRHLATHTRPADKVQWVCCGVPLLDAAAHGVPEKLIQGELFEFEGVLMVGGCRKTFSRRDAYGRHLGREKGRCFGDAHALYQPGNRDAAEH
ncbi:hypothetical protein C8T65DRAFT_827400 [Cerioporus squamosus]|nr:hypothetical protein C8T65DRAFT_827400 [Cerioporus squamosus]